MLRKRSYFGSSRCSYGKIQSGRVPSKIRNFRMSNEWYFPPSITDLVLFPLKHICHQELLDKMLEDRDEVAVLSAGSCFMWRSLTRIQNSTLPWYLPDRPRHVWWEKLTNFSRGSMQTGWTDLCTSKSKPDPPSTPGYVGLKWCFITILAARWVPSMWGIRAFCCFCPEEWGGRRSFPQGLLGTFLNVADITYGMLWLKVSFK